MSLSCCHYGKDCVLGAGNFNFAVERLFNLRYNKLVHNKFRIMNSDFVIVFRGKYSNSEICNLKERYIMCDV